jgi:hypothetical protein
MAVGGAFPADGRDCITDSRCTQVSDCDNALYIKQCVAEKKRPGKNKRGRFKPLPTETEKVGCDHTQILIFDKDHENR